MHNGLVTLQQHGGVTILSLNRPARHNALVPELLSSLLSAFESTECTLASVVILRAEGPSFSTGGDLLGFQQHRETIQDYAFDLVGKLNKVIMAMYKHPVPVVCTVQGQVTGGSLGFLLASDRVVMNQGATITPWYAEVGFSPDGGWTAMLPEIIGRQQTANWLLTNECFDAQTCFEIGLVHQLTEQDCDSEAMSWANKVAGMCPGSVRNSRILYSFDADTLDKRLEAERRAFVTQIQTQQALNGIEQFLWRHDHA